MKKITPSEIRKERSSMAEIAAEIDKNNNSKPSVEGLKKLYEVLEKEGHLSETIKPNNPMMESCIKNGEIG